MELHLMYPLHEIRLTIEANYVLCSFFSETNTNRSRPNET